MAFAGTLHIHHHNTHFYHVLTQVCKHDAQSSVTAQRPLTAAEVMIMDRLSPVTAATASSSHVVVVLACVAARYTWQPVGTSKDG